MYKQQPPKKPQYTPLNSQGRVLKVAIQPITISLMPDKRQEATDTPGSLPIRYQQPM